MSSAKIIKKFAFLIIICEFIINFAPIKYNAQYRLFFYSSPDETGIIVNALLFEISKHYE